METVRAGEAILRLPFLAPATYRAPSRTAAALPRRARPSQCHPSRAFTTSQCRRDPQSAHPQPPAREQNQQPRNFQSPVPSPRDSMGGDISSMLNSALDLNKNSPTAPDSRTSRFHSRNAQASNPPSRARANELSAAQSASQSSVDELINAMGSPGRQSNARSGSSRSSYNTADITAMLNPNSTGQRNEPPPPAAELPPMKLGPTVGRTIHVDTARNMDVGRAFRTLEIQCARNNVRKDHMRQRFHERPGLKRKRLKSERWRKNFKNNFKGIVAMVQKMRAQGW